MCRALADRLWSMEDLAVPVEAADAKVIEETRCDPGLNIHFGAVFMNVEDRPLADPFLPKSARFTLVVFLFTVVGAFAWAMWALGVNAQHPFSWPWTLLMFSDLGRTLWSASRKIARRRQADEAGHEKTGGEESSS